ncbi:MAG TPA: UDP-glucose 4-epimerase GalE [Chloroflexota bacterium]|nr:UDP-glucose 4-epimerase GalE [Chloroflexota bacterium]
MRILVTGGAGYIGSHTAKQLSGAGHEPITFDNLSEGHRRAVKWGPLIEADLGDGGLLRDVMREYRVEAVIHFAASAYVGESVREPRKYFRNNVINALHVLEAMQDAGVPHIVFSSTCATYGVPRHLPISEQHPQAPVNPYGESKLFVERALRWYGVAYGLSWMALRYFNAAGGDPEGQIGEDHYPETHLIPLAVQAALGEIPHLDIFGDDYPTPDGTPIRDYIHVYDLARAHVLALEYLAAGGESQALNLGTGHGHSVRQVVETVERVGGRPVPTRQVGRRAGDPEALVADAAHAQQVLGWTPEYPELGSMVETTWRWRAQHVGAGALPAD